jgi:hypothetical protein
MGHKNSDEFRREAVRIALTSGRADAPTGRDRLRHRFLDVEQMDPVRPAR